MIGAFVAEMDYGIAEPITALFHLGGGPRRLRLPARAPGDRAAAGHRRVPPTPHGLGGRIGEHPRDARRHRDPRGGARALPRPGREGHRAHPRLHAVPRDARAARPRGHRGPDAAGGGRPLPLRPRGDRRPRSRPAAGCWPTTTAHWSGYDPERARQALAGGGGGPTGGGSSRRSACRLLDGQHIPFALRRSHLAAASMLTASRPRSAPPTRRARGRAADHQQLTGDPASTSPPSADLAGHGGNQRWPPGRRAADDEGLGSGSRTSSTYLRPNRDTVTDLVAELLPRARLTPMEGTYVAWLDLREYGITGSLHDHLLDHARVECTEGTDGGVAGQGHVRLIYAMPHPLRRSRRSPGSPACWSRAGPGETPRLHGSGAGRRPSSHSRVARI